MNKCINDVLLDYILIHLCFSYDIFTTDFAYKSIKYLKNY